MPHLATNEHVIELETKLAQQKEGVSILPGVLNLFEAISPDDWTINTAGTHMMATARLLQFEIKAPKEMATGDKVSITFSFCHSIHIVVPFFHL